MKFLEKLKTDRQDLISKLCDNIDSLERLALEQQAEIEKLKKIEHFADKTIEKQRAEIERLQKENKRFADIGKMYSEIRAEAIKEFKEKYKDHIKNFTGKFTDEMGFVVNLEAILFAVDFVADNLVKEMVGD